MGTRAKTLGGGKRNYRRINGRTTTAKYKETKRFYDSKAWRSIREQKQCANPLCEQCSTVERPVPMDEVDHIIPLRERPELSLDWRNLQSLCLKCHGVKTRMEQGGKNGQ